MGRGRRQRAESFGRRAETWALIWLRIKGYHPVARRWRSPVGEVDLIVRRGVTIVFVEVKARKTIRQAIESISPSQTRRIQRAALSWLQSHLHHEQSVNLHLRFDVVAIAKWQLPVHIKGAWRSPT